MEKEFDVLVAGELNVDIILNNIQAFPEIGKEILANDLSIVLGSSSAILASNLASLGTRVAFTGKTGTDVFSQIVFETLSRRRVDCRHVIRDERYPTGATIVLNYGQDRANITFPGAMNHFGINDIDFEFMSRAKHLHFSSCFIQPGMKKGLAELFRKAKEMGLTTSMDPQWDPEEKWELPLEELMPNVDVFMPNVVELKNITGASSLENAVKKLRNLANLLVVKNGEEGAWLWDGQTLSHQQAFKNDQVVDCIGAGDSFNAGFLSEFVKKSSLTKCMETGALMGAINTTRAGGTAAFEDYNTVRAIAKERFNYNL